MTLFTREQWAQMTPHQRKLVGILRTRQVEEARTLHERAYHSRRRILALVEEAYRATDA